MQRDVAWACPELGTERLVAAAAGMVREYAPWNVWGTLTYGQPVTRAQCHRDVRTWLRTVARNIVREHVPCFVAFDVQQGGSPHAHVLLAIPPDRIRGARTAMHTALHTAWANTCPQAGFTKFTAAGHDPALYAVRKHDSWTLDVACHRPRPCRRRRGCLKAPGPFSMT